MQVEIKKEVLVELTNLVAELPYGQVKDVVEKLEKILMSEDAKNVDILDTELDQNILNIFDTALVRAPYSKARPLYDYLNGLLAAAQQKESDEPQQELVD